MHPLLSLAAAFILHAHPKTCKRKPSRIVRYLFFFDIHRVREANDSWPQMSRKGLSPKTATFKSASRWVGWGGDEYVLKKMNWTVFLTFKAFEAFLLRLTSQAGLSSHLFNFPFASHTVFCCISQRRYWDANPAQLSCSILKLF